MNDTSVTSPVPEWARPALQTLTRLGSKHGGEVRGPERLSDRFGHVASWRWRTGDLGTARGTVTVTLGLLAGDKNARWDVQVELHGSPYAWTLMVPEVRRVVRAVERAGICDGATL